MLKSLLIIYFLLPVKVFAAEYSWSDLENKILGTNLDVQAQTHEMRAAKHESKATLSPFLPSVSVNAGAGRNSKASDNERGIQVFVEGKWNLYRGGKDNALQDKSSLLAEIKQVDLDITKRATLFRAKEIFFNLLTIEKSLEVLGRESDLNMQQSNMAKKKVGAGLTSSVDEIEFELRSDLILAEKNKLLSEKAREQENLRSLVDFDEKPFTITGILKAPENSDLEPTNNLQSPEGILAKLNLHAAEADQRIARSGYLPEINLIGSYGRVTMQENDPIKNNETSALLSVSIPLFSGLETYSLSKAESERVSAKEKLLRQKQNSLRTLEFNLRTRWKETWALYELNQRTLERVKKYYDLTLSEYRRGIKNSPDLVSATELLFDAEIKSLNLLRDLNIIKSEFDKTFQ